MNGTGLQTVIQYGLRSPQDIAVDWIGENIYWIDMGNNPRIEVSGLDGTARQVVVWKDISKPRYIAVNPINGYLEIYIA